jgi:hypothetical protein
VWKSRPGEARLPGLRQAKTQVRVAIVDLSPLLRGWENYFRTGNASTKFRQAGDYVLHRLPSLMIKKRGRNLRAGQAGRGRKSGSTGTAFTGSAAPSATRRRRNHVGRSSLSRMWETPTYGLKGGWGRPCTGTAPLTTNGYP